MERQVNAANGHPIGRPFAGAPIAKMLDDLRNGFA
jgi:hypothetical protein